MNLGVAATVGGVCHGAERPVRWAPGSLPLSLFEYISILTSIILGLALAHLLAGVGRLIANPRAVRVYWVHLVWVAYQFISLIFIWWFQFRLRELQTWSFPTYGFLIIYFTVAYLQCVILLPRDPPHDQGFRDYYYDRRKWFFGLWILGLLLDIGDSAIKGREHFASLGLEYSVRAALQIGLYVTAAFWSNERFHAALALASLFYVITWALRVYPQLS